MLRVNSLYYIRNTLLSFSLAFIFLSFGLSAEEQVGAAIVEEITVTASRHAESIQDVSIPVTALSAATIEKMGADNIQDYYRTVPNFSVVDRGPGSRLYTMRGISAGIVPLGAATVGVYIDEMPVTANGFQPDLKLFDLERVEVLRGPQGTLYGEGSMGGTVRMITPNPNPAAFDTKIAVDYSSTKRGGDNVSVNGMVNVPISDSAALRLTAYSRDIDGFIDRVAQPGGVVADFNAVFGLPPNTIPVLDSGPIAGAKNINDEQTYGGRASFLVDVTDKLTIKLSYLLQESEYGHRNTEIPSQGKFNTNFYLDEEVDDELDLANLSITYDLGWATLISSSSIYERTRDSLSDNADLGESFFESIGIPGIKLAGVGTFTTELQDQFSQEVRLSSSGEGALAWTVGVFYVDKENGFEQIIVDEENFFVGAVNVLGIPATNARQLLDLDGFTDEKQFAVYGEFNYQFGDNWSATFGLRYFDYEQDNVIVNNDINILGLGLTDSVSETSESDVSIKIGLSFTPSEDTLLYGLVSEGFRTGGTNTAPGIPDENTTYDSDSLWNYEVGAKMTLMDGRVLFNVAAFYLDWSDIQLAVPLGFSFANINAGEARVIGAELEILMRPTENLELGFALGINDGELTEDVPGANDPGNPNPGFDGDTLPGTPDVNFNLSAQYNFPLSSFGAEGFARADYSYTGKSATTFNSSSFTDFGDGSHFKLDSYGLLNLRFGVQSDHWTATLYINNATNKLAELLTDNAAAVTRITRNRPRTVGLKLQYNL